MARFSRPLAALCGVALLHALAGTARAFDSKGHKVIEALAYRTLLEGHDGEPPRPDVLRDLINDGALVSPVCFGGAGQPKACAHAAIDNPLLAWPEPRTDRPDAAFRRQFSDAGQCFHFMATLADEGSPPMEGHRLPRALATTAVVRCRDLLDRLLREIVIVGGSEARESGYGLYELMHSVGDSFSLAHAQRAPGGHAIEFLRVWAPIAVLAGNRLGGTYALSPTRHESNEPRDKAYVRNFAEVDGRPCKDLTDYPYQVPFECLSQEGDLARQALVELLVVVRDLRLAHVARSAENERDNEWTPELSKGWIDYKNDWFQQTTPCEGEECGARQPAELVPTNDVLIGLNGTYNPTQRFYGASLRGMLLRSSFDLNPFVYGISADIGYRRQIDGQANLAVVGLELDLFLPIARRALVGLVPVVSRHVFGDGAYRGHELLTQALRVDILPLPNVWVGIAGPAEMNWITGHAAWSMALTLGLSPSLRETPADDLIPKSRGTVERHDETWAPKPLWYGRLKGRTPSWYVTAATTLTTDPAVTIPGRHYGGGSVGALVSWDRDRWGERYATAYGLSLQIGDRNTSDAFSYLTGSLGIELRWYPLQVLGLSLVPARVEGGPRISGSGVDLAADVHGSGKAYYLQAGSRIGLALRAGLIALIVQAPTLAWHVHPVDAGEILTFQIAFKVH